MSEVREIKWSGIQPQSKVDRFAVRFLVWRGVLADDYHGAPWLRHGDEGWLVVSRPLSLWSAIRAAWLDTRMWKPARPDNVVKLSK